MLTTVGFGLAIASNVKQEKARWRALTSMLKIARKYVVFSAVLVITAEKHPAQGADGTRPRRTRRSRAIRLLRKEKKRQSLTASCPGSEHSKLATPI